MNTNNERHKSKTFNDFKTSVIPETEHRYDKIIIK